MPKQRQCDGETPSASTLLYSLMLTCERCQSAYCIKRGQEIPFGPRLCQKHRTAGSKPTSKTTSDTKQLSRLQPAAKRQPAQQPERLPQAAIVVQKRSKKDRIADLRKLDETDAERSNQDTDPLTISSSRSIKRRERTSLDPTNSTICTGLLTPPMTPDLVENRPFDLGAVVMVRVGKTDWPARIVDRDMRAQKYLVRFDGFHKGQETWHNAIHVQGLDDVARRPRQRTSTGPTTYA
eukprot:TRINITY_DN151_c0_g1_i1.p1 TRINITY_DN151_c0_g1~~TRINITY_DN151_c0_g1_i1.p1  ORF type:complete len:237 (+),score=11.43 TRINITY_DN151_c0_g1_i1:149-859(+)